MHYCYDPVPAPVNNDHAIPGTLDRITMSIDLVNGSSGSGPVQYAPKDGSDNVVTSMTANGWQAPVLDIDFPISIVPSSTNGHYHLYLDKTIDLPRYVALVEALVDAGIVEEGVLYSLKQRGYTCVRLPWIKKPHAKP